MEHALVTGGAGFIGSHSAEALLGAGLRVTVLDDFSSGRRENLPGHAELTVISGDVRDTATVSAAMQGITRVLHLAAQVSVTASVEDPVASSARNVVGFLNVLDAARRAKVARFVYASSAAVYGTSEHLPLDESSLVAPLSPYGLEKCINDQYAALFGQLYGISCLGLRYFNVYGPRQDPRSPYAGVISIFAERAQAGKPITVFGDGGQTRDFIFVRDVARTNVAALHGTETGICNVATGKSVTLLDLIGAIETNLGRLIDVQFAPAREGDIRLSASRNERLVTRLGISGFTPLTVGLRTLLDEAGTD